MPLIPTVNGANLRDHRSAFLGFIGIAQRDITPPEGIYARNWGASEHDSAEGVHRPLVAVIYTLQSDHNSLPAILVGLDLGWWRSYKDERFVREYVLQELQIGPERLMLSLTHTHAGPVLSEDEAEAPGGNLIPGYLDALRKTIVEAVRSALSSAGPGRIDWSYGTCSLARNRDLPDPDQDRILLGYNPNGPADATLLVGRIELEGAGIAGVIANYACHPTTLAWENRLISPDFVGSARELIASELCGAAFLFLQGASGELAPRRNYASPSEAADANGRMLGYAVLSTLEGMDPGSGTLRFKGVMESGAPLGVWLREEHEPGLQIECSMLQVELPLQPLPSLDDLEVQFTGCADRVLCERLNRKRRIREAVGCGDTAAMPFWVWRIGDSFLIGHPNEAYSLLQTTLRERFPTNALVVMNVVNGHFGYLPPAELYTKDLYQVWQSPFGPGCLEILIEACSTELQRLM